MGEFLAELKRRNVIRVAAAYTVVAWVIAQVFDLAADNFGAPPWVMQFALVGLVAGLPVAILLSWVFELTPGGVVKSTDVPVSSSITPKTGQRLNRLTVGALILALAFIAWDKLGPTPEGTVVEARAKSVAVLPFADLSQDQDQEWFADGLTEEILNSLARLPQLLVTARTSSFEFKNTNTDIGEIARRLGVEHIVEGSVRKIGDDLRVTAQLIRAQDGFHLWSNTYNRKAADLFEVQLEVAESIAEALDVVLDSSMRERLFQSGTRNIEAFKAFRQGVALFDRAHERNQDRLVTLADANVYFERALAIDPNISGAALLHSDRFAHRLTEGNATIIGGDQLDASEAYEMLMADLEQSVAVASNPVSKLFAEINLELFSPTWHRMPGLVRKLKSALAAGEYLPIGEAVWANEALVFLGEFETAEMLAQHRLRVDPLAPTGWMDLVDLAMHRGNLDGARTHLDNVISRFGNSPAAQWRAIDIEISQGNKEATLALLTDDFVSTPPYSAYQPLRAVLQGDLDEAMRLVESLEAAGDLGAYLPIAFSAIGDRERARQAIRNIDGKVAGPTMLAIQLSSRAAQFWFDLDDAPNFRRQLEEAGVDGSVYEMRP
jgi:TolB-like protein